MKKEDEIVSTQEIEVNDPQLLRPKELPLVVKLPENASNAQIAFAKTINAYAYQNPEKWADKKDALIAKLRSLENAPDPVTNTKLRINNANIL